MNSIIVKLKVHESQIDSVTVGQPVNITIDALPGQAFTGKVQKKAMLPDSEQSWLNNNLKVYVTEISIDRNGTDLTLRPGMNATAEIIIEKLEGVLSIPCQSVYTDENGKHTCYGADGRPIPVVLGKRNSVFVVVEEGLQPGDVILMSPPALSSKDSSSDAPDTP